MSSQLLAFHWRSLNRFHPSILYMLAASMPRFTYAKIVGYITSICSPPKVLAFGDTLKTQIIIVRRLDASENKFPNCSPMARVIPPMPRRHSAIIVVSISSRALTTITLFVLTLSCRDSEIDHFRN